MPNQETLSRVTELLNAGVSGVDTFFHVVAFGRLGEVDTQMPLLLLDALSSDSAERIQLAKRYRIIVTHCDSVDDAAEDTLSKFRGALMQTFPPELSAAVSSCIFVENNKRLTSDYNDRQKIQADVIKELRCCRETRAVCYQPKLLSAVFEDVKAELRACFEGHVEGDFLLKATHEDLIGIKKFFNNIIVTKKWQPTRETDNLPKDFVVMWRKIGERPAVRDALAISLAPQAVNALECVLKTIMFGTTLFGKTRCSLM